MGRNEIYSIGEPEQLEALASVVRREVVDTVRSLGTCSIRELASALGRPADGLYYHVRKLVAVGLLLETHSGEETLLSAPARGELRLRLDPDDEDNVAAINRIVASMVRVAERDFDAGFCAELARCSGPRRNLHACRRKAWLSDDDVREVNRLVRRLQQIFRTGSAKAGKLHSMTFVMAPIEPAGPRRGEDLD